MKLALVSIILPVAQITFATVGGATLNELLTNTNRTGTTLLDQGYRGEFTQVYEEVPSPGEEHRPMEFTHAWFNESGIGKRAPAAPAIAIGIPGRGGNEGAAKFLRSLTSYREAIPAFGDLKTMGRVKDFEKVFGPSRGITDRWGRPGEMQSSLSWMLFSLRKDGSIRVVDVFLHTVDKGNGWEIWKRDIKEGVFRPTGRAPKLEIEGAEQAEAPNERQ